MFTELNIKENRNLSQIVDLRQFVNLNKLFVTDHSTVSSNIEIVLKGLKSKLIQCIQQADAVIGAVAWITDVDILSALSDRPSLLIIQKEDFLRPDMASRLTREVKEDLHKHYKSFKPFDGHKISVGPFSQGCDNEFSALDPILCFGYQKQGQGFRLPKMHNKFVVFIPKSRKPEIYVA